MLSLRVSSDIDVTINREHLYVQCRSVAKCLESLLLLKHTFLPKPFFQRVWLVFKMVVETPKEWGYFSGQKMEIPGRRGPYAKFPPWWGYGYFLELPIVFIIFEIFSQCT